VPTFLVSWHTKCKNMNKNTNFYSHLPKNKMAELSGISQVKNFLGKFEKWQIGLMGGVVLAIIIGLLAIIINSGTDKPKEILFSGLEGQDAAKIVEKLKEKKIPYELKDGGATVMVDQSTVYETRLALASEGLPENSYVGYELFDKTNLGMSEFVQKLNHKRALEGELTRTITSLEEVKKARVHIVIPEKTLFAKDQKEPTASVTLHLKSGRSLSKVSIEGIQNLLAASVEGMTIEHVTVVDSRGKILSESPIDINSVAGLTDAQLQQQRNYEQYLAGKVQSILDGVLGVGNAQVQVNAELDFTRREQTITDYDPEKQAIRSEQGIAKKNQSADSLSYPYVSMNQDEVNQITNYEVSKNQEVILHAVGSVKRLSVSVLINGNIKIIETEGIKAPEYTARTEDEMQKFEEIVKNAVGYDPQRADRISVLNIPFDPLLDYEDITDYYRGPWYADPENQKIIWLLAAIFVTILLMIILLQSKYVKERFRIAMSLPDKVDIKDDDLEEEEEQPDLEELDFDDSDFMLLPADLPDQLLLEGDRSDKQLQDALELEGDSEFDKDALARAASAGLDDDEVLSEGAMMKLEMKNKVEEFIDQHTEEAVKILRMIMAQDIDMRNFKF